MAEKRALEDTGDRFETRNADAPAGSASAESGPPDVRERVEALRRRIDELDEQLVELLSARAACALQVGREKKRLGLEIYQPSREADVLAHVQRMNKGPLNDASIKRLFERIIDEARRLEREAEVKNADGDIGEQTPEG